MPYYHLRFIEKDGRVAIGEDYQCEDDGAALLLAQSEMERRNYQGSEIWLGERRVSRLTVAHVNGAPNGAGPSSAMVQPPSERSEEAV